MSDIDEQAITPDAASEAASPVQEPDEAWRDEIRSRYGADLDDAALLRQTWQSYRNAEQRLSSREQRPATPEPEPEPQWNPLDDLDPTQDEGVAQRFYNDANRNGVDHAAQIALAALDRGDATVTPSLVNQLFSAWASQDFLAAQNYMAQRQEYQIRQQLQAEMQEQYAPLMANHTQATLDSAVQLAAAQRPDLDPAKNPQADELRGAVYGFLVQKVPQWFQGEQRLSAQQLAEMLVWGRDIVFGQQTSGQFAPPTPTGEQPDPDAAKARAATTRPRGASTSRNDDRAKKMKEEILAEAPRLR